MIELRGREIFVRPRLSGIDGNVSAAVIAFDHAFVIGGIDPQIVIVAVRRAKVVLNVLPPSVDL